MFAIGVHYGAYYICKEEGLAVVWWVWENPVTYTEEVNGVPCPGRKVFPWKEGRSWLVPERRWEDGRVGGGNLVWEAFCRILWLLYIFLHLIIFLGVLRKESGLMYCHRTNSAVKTFLNFSYYLFLSLSGAQKKVLRGLAVRSAQGSALIQQSS